MSQSLSVSDALKQTQRVLIEKFAFVPPPEYQLEQAQAAVAQAQDQLEALMPVVPPEMQQQIMAYVQQMGQLPPEQAAAELQNLVPQVQQMVTQFMQAGAMGGAVPPQQPGAVPPQAGAPVPGAPQGADGQQPTDLDNTFVTMSVRQMMDLQSGGKASQTQMKIEQMKQQQEQKAQEQQQAQQQQSALYPSPGQPGMPVAPGAQQPGPV